MRGGQQFAEAGQEAPMELTVDVLRYLSDFVCVLEYRVVARRWRAALDGRDFNRVHEIAIQVAHCTCSAEKRLSYHAHYPRLLVGKVFGNLSERERLRLKRQRCD